MGDIRKLIDLKDDQKQILIDLLDQEINKIDPNLSPLVIKLVKNNLTEIRKSIFLSTTQVVSETNTWKPTPIKKAEDVIIIDKPEPKVCLNAGNQDPTAFTKKIESVELTEFQGNFKLLRIMIKDYCKEIENGWFSLIDFYRRYHLKASTNLGQQFRYQCEYFIGLKQMEKRWDSDNNVSVQYRMIN